MYDILQLNDLLVPELLDIAEQLEISNAKKLNKQDLIYKILDKQAIMTAAQKPEDEKPKQRKRIVKATTANISEEAEVVQEAPAKKETTATPKTKKVEVEEFIESSTANQLNELVLELESYLEGGADSEHKQLREAYGHIPKPMARKIKEYLYGILEDAWKYNHDKRRGRRKKQTK